MKTTRMWVFALAILPAGVAAQGTGQQAKEWDVTQARGQTKVVDFTTEEGTWPSVDVSPDGTWMVFDPFGHMYRAPFPARKRDGKLPGRTLSLEGGMFPRWRDADTVDFGSGTRWYAYRVAEQAADTVHVSLTVQRDIPPGDRSVRLRAHHHHGGRRGHRGGHGGGEGRGGLRR